MKPEEWAAILASLGVGAILLESVKAGWKWFSGRVGRERDAVAYEREIAAKERKRADDADERADELDRKLDEETAARRMLNRHLAYLERLLILNGIDFGGLDENTIPRNKLIADSAERKAI